MVIGAKFCRGCGNPARTAKHSRTEPPANRPRVMTSLAQIRSAPAEPALPPASAPAAEPNSPAAPNPLTPPPVDVAALVDSTQVMPPIEEVEQRSVFAGASLRALAERGRPVRDSAGKPGKTDRRSLDRHTLILSIAGAIALVVVVALIATVASNRNDTPLAETGADSVGADPVELGNRAEIVVPETAKASNDWAGNRVTYEPANLTDGDPATAWRMPGNGEGSELTLSWDERQTFTEVGLINGYAKIDAKRGDNWYEINRQVEAVTWVFDDGTEVAQSFDTVTDMQSITLDEPVTAQTVRLRIDAVTEPNGKDFTALSEISVKGG